MNPMPKKRNPKRTTVAIHLLGWGLLLVFPLLMRWQNSRESVSLAWYAGCVAMPLSFMAVFYVNYFRLIPRLLFQKRWGAFLGWNLLLWIAVWYAGRLWWDFYTANLVELPGPPHNGKSEPHLFFFVRDIFSFALMVALAVAIKMTSRWQQSERQRHEAERRRAQAELTNLKNQLNPHFLFNTLNNIYALVEVDPPAAQHNLHELSRLLRYVLYEGGPSMVPLEKELEFLQNYIDLMSLRTGANVSRQIRLSCDAPGAQVAPLIFISLVENAFKHGVSPCEPSFVHIDIHTEDRRIVCRTANSDHPKTDADRSGSGIGTRNLEKRLRLIYGMEYSLSRSVKDGVYRCQLILPDRPADRPQ